MSGWSWRPSLFEPSVSHLTQDGTVPRVSERFGEQRWVHGACGQNTSADQIETWWMARCLECMAWLRAQQRDVTEMANINNQECPKCGKRVEACDGHPSTE